MTPGSRVATGLLADKERLGRRAYERLLEMLARRELPRNTVLQERKLAELLEISRTPVREALNRLESEGLLSRMPGGALVPKDFSTRELLETLNVRALLEAEAARLATGNIPAGELDEIEAAVNRLLSTDRPDPADDWAVDSRLHGMVAEHAGNAVLARMIEALRFKTHMFNLASVPERFAVGHREHLGIIDALRRNDRGAAQAAIREHIENVKQSIVKKLSDI